MILGKSPSPVEAEKVGSDEAPGWPRFDEVGSAWAASGSSGMSGFASLAVMEAREVGGWLAEESRFWTGLNATIFT